MASAICAPDVESVVRSVTAQLHQQLPEAIAQLLQSHDDLQGEQFTIECSLLKTGSNGVPERLKFASLDIDGNQTPAPRLAATSASLSVSPSTPNTRALSARVIDLSPISSPDSPAPCVESSNSRPAKRRKATGGLHVRQSRGSQSLVTRVIQRPESHPPALSSRKRRVAKNQALRPSTFDKFISGVWESLYCGIKLDPAEVIGQWQAIEGHEQPWLLLETDHEVAARDEAVAQGNFSRMNVLTRKISQTSRTCRSLEVIIQAHWIQCFDARVEQLSGSTAKEKAKKTAIIEACVDFNWSEKELRNRMGIWRGYHEIKDAAGWAALVFAGSGLYRLCKYRVSFTAEAFETLKALKHRFEVAADTLHPRWRDLLGIIGGPTDRRYIGHPHDWVVCGPDNEAIPLAETYRQWHLDFTYDHLEESIIDEEAWGLFDPRVEIPATSPRVNECQVCGEHQSDDPKQNNCVCFPNLYGSFKAGSLPVQVFRTPDGKNNGLIACCAIEKGSAIGEFVGLVTSGLSNLDVMLGATPRATYQIWQGKAGNHIRFINHSCAANSRYERFTWLGLQRIVLVSEGIEADEEITVDYSDTYWQNLDKTCLCGQPNCRYSGARDITYG